MSTLLTVFLSITFNKYPTEIQKNSMSIELENDIKDDIENVDGMEASMEKPESCEKSSGIEEFCKKILKIEGFKSLLDNKNLKEILKDRLIKSILNDLNLRKVMKEKNWEFEIAIEEIENNQEFDNISSLENGTTENKNYTNDLPINSAEIKQETEDYLEVNLHEIHPSDIKQEDNNSDFEIKVANNFENSVYISEEFIDFNDPDIIESKAKSEEVSQISDKNNKVQCPLCEKILTNKQILERHISSVHENLHPFTCTHCDMTFKTKPCLKNHFLSVHFQKNENELPPDLVKKSPKHKSCPRCEETFLDLKSFKNHFRTVHPDARDYQCADCGKAFRFKANLAHHNKHVHQKVKRIRKKTYKPLTKQCPKCDKSFQENSTLKHHIAVVHEGKIPYVCPQCGKGFKTAQGLNGHIIGIHEGAKKFLCSLCPSSYLTKSALTLHVRDVHEGLKPHLCVQCGKRFGSGSRLNNHIKKVHEKDLNQVKIKVCNLCQEEFKSKYDLNIHKLTVHDGVEPLMCPQCPMAFARSKNLAQHLMVVHTTQQFDCSQCDSKFKTKNGLNAHVFSAHTDGEVTWKCSHCPETFKTSYKKVKHVRDVHPETLKKLRLTTNSASNYATEERVCPHCNKMLKNKYYLKKHISELH